MMFQGDLTERVTFQREERVRDAGGGWEKAWGDLFTVWAKVTPKSGRERDMAQQREAPSNYRVTIRRRADVLPADRLIWNGYVGNIRFVGNNSARDQFVTIDVEFGVTT